MAEVRKIRLLSEEPELAKILRTLQKQVRIGVIPEEYIDWAIDWVEDVGKIMRERSFMAYSAAMYLSMALVSAPFVAFPELKRGFLAKVLGVK